jgi:hypothetical protein
MNSEPQSTLGTVEDERFADTMNGRPTDAEHRSRLAFADTVPQKRSMKRSTWRSPAANVVD